MHGVNALKDLGSDVTQYRERFQLRYRNNHALEDGQYPIERAISGERLTDVVVEFLPATDNSVNWVHRVRSLVLTDSNGEPDVREGKPQSNTELADLTKREGEVFEALCHGHSDKK